MKIKPVTKWENEELGREVFMSQMLRAKHMARVDELRARHAEYLASLPTDTQGCLVAALEVLQSEEPTSLKEGLDEAFHLAFAIEPMISDLMAETPGPHLDAVLFVARRIRNGLESALPKLKHLEKILGNPALVTKQQ